MAKSKKSGVGKLPINAMRRDLLTEHFRKVHRGQLDQRTMQAFRSQLEDLMPRYPNNTLTRAIEAASGPSDIPAEAERLQREAASSVRYRTTKSTKPIRLSDLEVGHIVTGTVTNVREFGAFVEIAPRLTGLVHSSEIAWEHVKDPSKYLKQGRRVQVKVINVDLQRQRVSLSIKQTLPDPWQSFSTRNEVNDLILGTVTGASDFGVFVAVAPGVSGLVHQTELPPGIQPARLKKGLKLWVRIDNIDADAQKLSLSAREVTSSSDVRTDGYRPMELRDVLGWADVGISVEGSRPWEREGFGPTDARSWVKAGLNQPESAAEWRTEGISSHDARPWRDFPPTKAIPWYRLGLDPPTARKWGNSFTAASAKQWIVEGWDLATAEPWHKASFDPTAARIWSDAGVPAHAAQLWRNAGVSVADTCTWMACTHQPDIALEALRRGWTTADAAAWADAGFPLDVALQWDSRDFAIADAEDWLPSFPDPDEACRWRDRGIPSSQAAKWVTSHVAPTDAEEWSRLGWTFDEIGPWAQASLTPSAALEWHSAGFNVELAKAWDSRDFTHDEAAIWTRCGIGPKAASKWRTCGFTSNAAQAWVRSGWKPARAQEWVRAGFVNADNAARWRGAGWHATEALQALAAGVAPSSKNGIGGFGQPRVVSRGDRTGDALFGSPRSDKDLRRWARSFDGLASPRLKLSSEQLSALKSYNPPPRLTPVDVKTLRQQLITRIHDDGWPEGIAGLAHFAAPVLVEAPELNVMFDAEPPPADLLPDVELPFDQVMLLFGARFLIGEAERRQLPNWSPGDSREHLPYEPWLAHIGNAGAGLAGVMLRSGPTGSGVADECVWLVEVEGVYIPVPSYRSRSALDEIAQNLAAALCFGSWCKSMPGRRLPGTRRSARAPKPKAPPPVHVVDVRANRAPRNIGRGSVESRSGHVRRGHWHRYWVGSGPSKHLEWRWVRPTWVGAYQPDSPEAIYRLPRLLFRTR